jgi:acyl-CoA thioesterase FadM
VLGADEKRLHLALELSCDDARGTAAVCEMMLLHVRQIPSVRATPFPPHVTAAIAELQLATAAMPASGPSSRRMELPRQ